MSSGECWNKSYVMTVNLDSYSKCLITNNGIQELGLPIGTCGHYFLRDRLSIKYAYGQQHCFFIATCDRLNPPYARQLHCALLTNCLPVFKK